MLLAASSPSLPPASGGSDGGRPGCRGMCLSPVVSSLLSSSKVLQDDPFSPRRTERGPPCSRRTAAGISSQCLWSREMISNEDERETETKRKRHQRESPCWSTFALNIVLLSSSNVTVDCPQT